MQVVLTLVPTLHSRFLHSPFETPLEYVWPTASPIRRGESAYSGRRPASLLAGSIHCWRLRHPSFSKERFLYMRLTECGRPVQDTLNDITIHAWSMAYTAYMTLCHYRIFGAGTSSEKRISETHAILILRLTAQSERTLHPQAVVRLHIGEVEIMP
jgi:hypothetical protein